MSPWFRRPLLPSKRKTPRTQGEPPTVPLPPHLGLPSKVGAFPGKLEYPQSEIGYAQSVGLQREHNEDALFILHTLLTSNGEPFPFGLYLIADGMGGHQQGEIASGLAVRTVATTIVRQVLEPLLSNPQELPQEALQQVLEKGFQEAHRGILEKAPGSGTTLTALLILDRLVTIAHVGDCRVYRIHPKGDLQVLTRDHSLVERLIELGEISAEEAATHPQRNVLYRALGQGEPLLPDLTTIPLPPGGYFMLCSDGLWGVVSATEIIRLVTTSPSPQAACQALVEAANAAGGPDNITVVLIRLPE